MQKKILILVIIILCFILCSCGKSEAIIAAENAIYAIGDVTLNSGPEIEKAEKAVEALSDEDKEKFEHYDKLAEIKNQYKQLEEEKKENTLKELKNKIQGFWMFSNSEFIGFENNTFYAGAYPGWISSGEIKNMVFDGENKIKLSVYYPETMNGPDEIVSAHTENICVDIYEINKISVVDGKGNIFKCDYVGKQFDDLKNKCDELRNQPELTTYTGKTVSDIIKEFGNSYKIEMFGSALALVYESTPYAFVYRDNLTRDEMIILRNRTPYTTAVISTVHLGCKGVKEGGIIADGIKIGDDINKIISKYKTNVIEAGKLQTYINGSKITVLYDFPDSKILAAWTGDIRKPSDW